MLVETRFVAAEPNATKRPSAVMGTFRSISAPSPLFGCDPSLATSARSVVGVQAEPAPQHVSRQNMPGTNPSFGTMFVASDRNPTKRPFELISP